MAIKPFPTGLTGGVSLDDLKDHAKTLLHAVDAGNPDALQRIKPYFDDASSLTLQRAQLVVAREHGFTSWRKAKAFIEARDEMLANPLQDVKLSPPLDDQLERRFGLARRMASALLESVGPNPSTRHCSFCFKPQEEVYKFIAGTGVFICDACVRVCAQIVADDKTDGIRGGDETAKRCSFCHKRAREVRTFIQSSADNICNECVELCAEIIEDGLESPSNPQALDDNIEHARQAVAERGDSDALVTLARSLLLRTASVDRETAKAYFDEAFGHLDRAIRQEREHEGDSRHTLKLSILLGGSIQFLKSGGQLSPDQVQRVSELLDEADRFPHEPGAKALAARLRGLLGG